MNYNKIGFIYTPFTAPPIPPLGIPLLSSFLKKNNITCAGYDLNIELYNFLLEHSNVINGFGIIEERINKFDNLEKSLENQNNVDLFALYMKKDYILENLNTAILDNEKELTREMVVEFIDCIHVNDDRSLKIDFKFSDELEKLMDLVNKVS